MDERPPLPFSAESGNGDRTKETFITTPLYYVNADPHIGHLHSSVMADTLRRFYLLKKFDASMSTGTDEHGMKIKEAASKNKTTPAELCDAVSARFKKLADKANIGYTTFIRTTESHHGKAVSHFWNKLVASGYIYKGRHEGWYSTEDETFYTESQVQEVKGDDSNSNNNNKGGTLTVSIESGQKVEMMAEENYLFKLSAFKTPLLKWIQQNPQVIIPQARKNEVIAWVQDGLTDLSVSRLRSRVDWAIPVPGDEQHQTVYVWLDALITYLTVSGYPPSSSLVKNNDDGLPVAKIHVIGKDIVLFHAVFWPALLLAAELPLPEQIVVHEHWLLGNIKMAKSCGNGVDPLDVMGRFGVDTVRYYLMCDGRLDKGMNFSENGIKQRNNKDLSGMLGNLLNRSTAMSLNPRMEIPDVILTGIDERDGTLHQTLLNVAQKFDEHFQARLFHKGISTVMDLVSEAHKHFNENRPWTLKGDKERLDVVLFYAYETCRIAGILLQTVMPTKMDLLLTKLSVPKNERSLTNATLCTAPTEKRRMGIENQILFPRF